MFSVCARDRPNTFNVVRPATTSRKWRARTFSVRSCLSVCARVAMPMSTMKTGMSGSVTAMITADSQSWLSTTAKIVTGTITARASCGRYFEK